MKRWNPILLFLLLVLVWSTCVDPVELKLAEQDDILVVDGSINVNDSVHTIRLIRTAPLGRSTAFPVEENAEVRILDQSGNMFSCNEEEPGVYRLRNFQPDPKHSYRLSIQLKNGKRFESTPQTTPTLVPIDSAYFIFDKINKLTLYAQIRIPDTVNSGPFLRWRISHAYQRTDKFCGFPDIGATTCYFKTRRATDNQLLPLLDGGRLVRGAVVQTSIGDAPVLDTIFGEVTYFTVVQETLTEEAFRYFERVNRLLIQTGSFFDIPPGTVRGNIFNVDDPDELILGVFFMNATTVDYVRTMPSDFLPLQINPYCGVAGFFPQPFPFECCYCTLWPNSTTEKPSYW